MAKAGDFLPQLKIGRKRRSPLDILRASLLFDAAWYRESHSDLRGKPMDAAKHYLEHGGREGRNPHPLFDSEWYLRHSTETAGCDTNPLIHYLLRKSYIGSHPHPLFDVDFYLAAAPDFRSTGLDPLSHYLTVGWRKGIKPNKNFDPLLYLEQNPDIRGSEPLTSYVLQGRQQNVRPPHLSDSTKNASAASEISFSSNSSTIVNQQRLRDYLVDDEFGFGAPLAERILQYLSILGDLTGPKKDSPKRAEMLASLTERLRRLSRAAASDRRAVAASIVIPVFNHVEYTLTCAISLLEHKCDVRYEIIIGNDRSIDETQAVFEAVGGIIRCIDHDTNRGFLRNCKLSAERGVGKYLVFLNNDTLALDYWLDELLGPFDRFKNVGLTGSKLLMADGSLQEAGGIIWSDGSGWNFGRRDDPRGYQFNYLKDADYLSGAAIAVPADLWKDIGGFDERYAPAYAEDADLAFHVRAKGLRAVYAPRSEIIHHEGASHGTDVSAGIKAHQVTNQSKFVEKWKPILLREQFPNGHQIFLARDRSRRRKHILVFDHYVPKVDRDGGSRMMYDFLKLFVDADLQVSFWPDNGHYDRDYARELQNWGIEIVYGRNVHSNFRDWIKQTGPYLDYAFLHRPHVTERYIDALCEHSPAKRLYYGSDLHFLRLEREYALTGREELLEVSKNTRRVETYVWQRSDVIYYPAPEEVSFVREQVPDKQVRVFPSQLYPDEGLRMARARAEQKRPDLPMILYVAGFAHSPNVDAILWFAREVLPIIKKRLPKCVTIIAGSYPPRSVIGLQREDVVVTQAVSWPVLEWFYNSAHVVIAPVRFGGGIKGKILEAMRYGVPVVTTSAGAEGIDTADQMMAIADAPEAFAEHVIRILRDPGSAHPRVLSGLDHLDRNLSYTAVSRRLSVDIPELERVATGHTTFKR